ncbi:MAG: glutathione S-transferase family protein [Pseudomonadota bacterium]|nr:glutathione S-transferase family protein [Pseudomonadota bacterium]
MNQIIIHHYPQSPVAEKLRVGLGIKELAWRSVEIPRLPPKPDLMPLTGGYRRIPVMQIGADIYCDSQCILRELERRFPAPSFFPDGNDGLAWGLARWTDDRLLDAVTRLVLGAGAGGLPEAYAADRCRLYFGPNWNTELHRIDLPHMTAQVRGQFGWFNQQLAGDRLFLGGDQPGLADALAYYLVWFVRGHWDGGPGLLGRFPALGAWEQRIAAIGHGTPTDMDAAEALDVADAAEPAGPEGVATGDPQDLALGVAVTVVPDEDGGDPAVSGTVRYADGETIAILREDPRVGRVCVHFPCIGYRVTVQ